MKRFLFMLALALSLSTSSYSQIKEEDLNLKVTISDSNPKDEETVRKHLNRAAVKMATRDQLLLVSSGLILIGYTGDKNSGMRSALTSLGVMLNIPAFILHLSVPRSLKKAAKSKRL